MKSLIRWQPFPELDSLEAQMNRMFENSAESPRRAEYNYFGRTCLLPSEEDLSATEFGPPVDIYEDHHNLTFKVEVPGIDEKQIKVGFGCRKRAKARRNKRSHDVHSVSE
jgi:HSP20 family molecular chaperone IbpA